MNRPPPRPAFLLPISMSAKMTTEASPAISHFEVSRLAWLNWQTDGCPSGRDLDYWLEAELQIKATRQLLINEERTSMGRKSESRKIRRNGARKIRVRPELERPL
jgi:hypothetical protein